MKKLSIGFFTFCIFTLGIAQTNVNLDPINHVYALTGGIVIQKPGVQLTEATIIIRDGIISGVGKDLKIPYDAQIIKLDSMFIYPGFIDGITTYGIPQKKTPSGSSANRSPGGSSVDLKTHPNNEKSGITAEKSALDLIDPKNKDLAELRKSGFTLAHIAPDGRMIAGQSIIAVLSGDSKEEMLLKDRQFLYAQFRGAERRIYPGTVIGIMAKWRDFYRNSKIAMHHEKLYSENPVGIKKPEIDAASRAMYPIIEKKQAVIFSTGGALAAYRALKLQEDLGFNLILANVKEGWHLTDRLKNNSTPVLLSLDLPKPLPKEKSQEKAKKEDPKNARKKKEVTQDPEREALQKRRKEAVKQHESQAAHFAEENITFGFGTLGTKIKDIQPNLHRIVKAGLSDDQALSALTTVPAKLLGIEDITGTIEAGKMANIVVTNRPYFSEKSQVRYVFANGIKYEYEEKAKSSAKKGAGDGPVSLAGIWSYNIDIPNQPTDGTITFKKNDDGYSGKISNSEFDNETLDLENIEVNGSKVTFEMQYVIEGNEVVLAYELTFDKEEFSGNVQVGEFGTFPIEGKIIENPN